MYGRNLPRRRKKITRKPVRINFTSATTKYDDPGTAAAADDWWWSASWVLGGGRYEREGWQYPAAAASATSDCAALGHQYWAFSTTILRFNTSPPQYCAPILLHRNTVHHQWNASPPQYMCITGENVHYRKEGCFGLYIPNDHRSGAGWVRVPGVRGSWSVGLVW